MFTRRSILGMFGLILFLMSTAPAAAQQEVVMGPPPELRRNMDAFLKAFNSGNADQYEAMAKATFAPEYYKREAPDARKTGFLKMVKEFGKIAFEQVERHGPEAPLEAQTKGSLASGVFWIDLDDAHRIAGIRTEVTKLIMPDADRRY